MRQTIKLLLLIVFAIAIAAAQPTIAPLPDNGGGPYLNVSASGTTTYYIFATPTGWPNSTYYISSYYVASGVPTGCTASDSQPFNNLAQYIVLTCTNTPAGSYSFTLVAYDNSGLRGTSRYFTIVSS